MRVCKTSCISHVYVTQQLMTALALHESLHLKLAESQPSPAVEGNASAITCHGRVGWRLSRLMLVHAARLSSVPHPQVKSDSFLALPLCASLALLAHSNTTGCLPLLGYVQSLPGQRKPLLRSRNQSPPMVSLTRWQASSRSRIRKAKERR